jgi:flagellar hook-associated protein 2
LTTEKRNRNFDPLTADQKKEMSENEIKLWNEKVEKGQLSRDTDLTRIANSLKNSMRTLVDGSGLNLEKIGIKPVSDYQGTKNGTFTIDENALTKALEENSEEVMNLFVKSKPTDENLSDSQKYSKTGLIQRIKDIIYNETMTSTSNFLKKVGYEGTVTAYNNTLTRSIEEYEKKMADMEIDFARREQALYSKYSTLETIMNKYNSQQSYLTQQLGMS